MQKYTEDWFTQHIPIWEHTLASLKDREIKGIELGSFEGRSAVWLAENIFTNDYSVLDCVDEFSGDPNLELSNFDWQEIKKRFIRNTKPYKQIRLNEMDSKEYLLQRTEKADFVYIDANHYAMDCLEDAVFSHRLLKVDGIMIFDDYLWDGLSTRPAVPKIAIDSFMNVYQTRYKILHIGYQVILKKMV